MNNEPTINRVFIINILNTIINKGLVLLSIPVFTRILSGEEYGRYEIIYSWSMIFACIIGGGVSGSLASGRAIFCEKYKEFRNSSLLFGIIISLTIGISTLAVEDNLCFFPYGRKILMLVIFLAQCRFIVDFALESSIYEKRPGISFVISFIANSIAIILSIFFAIKLDGDKSVLRLYGTIIGQSIAVLGILLLYFCYERSTVCSKYAKYGILIGIPVVFHELARMILIQSDRIMMQLLKISEVEIGVYSFFYSISNIISLILTTLNRTWIPFYQDSIKERDNHSLQKKSKNYFELFSCIMIVFILGVREISYIMGGEHYWNGISVEVLLALSVYFTFMYQFQVNYEFYVGETKLIAIGTGSSALINIFLNAFLIPRYGMYGAAISTLISFAFLFVFHYFIVKRMKSDIYQLSHVLYLKGLSSVLFSVVLFFALKNQWYLRWMIILLIGVHELLKMTRRKSII